MRPKFTWSNYQLHVMYFGSATIEFNWKYQIYNIEVWTVWCLIGHTNIKVIITTSSRNISIICWIMCSRIVFMDDEPLRYNGLFIFDSGYDIFGKHLLDLCTVNLGMIFCFKVPAGQLRMICCALYCKMKGKIPISPSNICYQY